MEQSLLALEGVSSGYGSIVAARNVSLDVSPGEIVALLGANGAGKSTILKTIAGLVRPTSGSITYRGERLDLLKAEDIVRHGIVLTPEGRGIFAHLTVLENLRLGAATRSDKKAIQEDIVEMCELFPILGQRQKQLAGTLSGGEQQMLAVARSLMSRPQMMLLDEPSLGLAPRVVTQIYALLHDLPARGVALLLVEQNVTLALDVADRGYVMVTGEMQIAGTAKELREAVDIEHAYLGTTSGPSGATEGRKIRGSA